MPDGALTIDSIAAALSGAVPLWTRRNDIRWRAAVALVLRERDGVTEVLLIRRAEREGDPWSGHAALPGGRAEPDDVDIVATAARETFEEVGLDLSNACVLGALSQHPPPSQERWARFTVTPVVFVVEGDPPLALQSREVAEARWVPLAALLGGSGYRLHWLRPVKRGPPIVPMLLPHWRHEGLTVWGLTHGMISELLERVGVGSVRR